MIKDNINFIREIYPRIAEAIELTWGTMECDAYLNKLILDERGDRQGFPVAVLGALLQLSMAHSELLKSITPKKRDKLWEFGQ